MRRFLYLLSGALFGVFLGYVSFNLMLHIASLFMDSDDDLNKSVYYSLLFFPVIFSLSLYFFHSLCSRSEKKLTRAAFWFFCFYGALSGMLIGYFFLGMAIILFDLRDWMDLTRGQEKVFLFSFLVASLCTSGFWAHRKIKTMF